MPMDAIVILFDLLALFMSDASDAAFSRVRAD